MERGSEHEAHADLAEAPLHALRPQVDLDAGGLEHVGAAGRAGDGAVAVLGDAEAGANGHQRGDGRDVDGVRAVAAGAAGVHDVAINMDAQGLVAHDLRHAGNLLGGLALDAQRRHECAELRGRGLARHDLLHDAGGEIRRQVFACDQVGYCLLYHVGIAPVLGVARRRSATSAQGVRLTSRSS